jgi:hypothetical protein
LTLRSLPLAAHWSRTARFTLVSILLGVSLLISANAHAASLGVSKFGAGAVTSWPSGINCGSSCSASYASGSNVSLIAIAASGYRFSGWSGACSGTGALCTVSMTTARSVAATFSPTISSTTTLTLASDPQCSGSGLAATDLSSQCRASEPTPGAFEAIDPSTLPIRVTWSPYPGTVSGYIIYYGPTSTTATNLASDVPIGTANFDPAAPAVSYRAQDLGLSPGNAVCFQIFAYDTAHALYNWSKIQCTVTQ